MDFCLFLYGWNFLCGPCVPPPFTVKIYHPLFFFLSPSLRTYSILSSLFWTVDMKAQLGSAQKTNFVLNSVQPFCILSAYFQTTNFWWTWTNLSFGNKAEQRLSSIHLAKWEWWNSGQNQCPPVMCVNVCEWSGGCWSAHSSCWACMAVAVASHFGFGIWNRERRKFRMETLEWWDQNWGWWCIRWEAGEHGVGIVGKGD